MSERRFERLRELVRRMREGPPMTYAEQVNPLGWVYFVRGLDLSTKQLYGPVKIGFTRGDVCARMAALQTGNGLFLEILARIPGDETTERALHARFADIRVRGEWFAFTGRLESFIEGVREAQAAFTYARLTIEAARASVEPVST